LLYHSNIDIWWVSQDERILVYPNHQLGQHHSKPILILGRICLGARVLAWHVNLNHIENKFTVKYPYPTGFQKCEILIIEPGLHKRKDNPRLTLEFILRSLGAFILV
jgi:hypothetical protein